MKLLVVASICCSSIAGLSGTAFAACTIQSSRLQQISDREILAIIDGKCTKEVGESGYFTKISPGVFGEVMAVSGSRRIDQYGFGWQASYGYNIVFSEISETYAAGVWIADADGVVHSEEMTIQNSYMTTTSTTSTTIAPTTTTLVPSSPAKAVGVNPQQTNVSTTTSSNVLVDDGLEGDFAELAVRAIGNKWEIKADTSYSSTSMTVRFRKSGSRMVTWNIVTTGEGTRRILTSRNLSGGTLTLLAQGQIVDRLLVP